MDIHYNAFISYRHHPQDIKVAETIHRALERFKVPKALKKEGKCIERIFRDKEELPITSSLTDTITMALRNSDYQIVICSTHLKDSYWVQREIETFLQTHSKDKVLTVLVDGDNPYDVIPEILTYNEVVDPVTGEVTRESIEPLSCDWRLPKREAMKKELPRLAAVLLGCSYDDLIQRQKQYRQRRLLTGISIGMAASLALAGYFMYTSIQIQENLNQSLRNQSQYLASTAQEKFDSGDRLTAIALALEGLPSEENARPYVAEAEAALGTAIGLYSAHTDVEAIGAFSVDAEIHKFIVSDDRTRVFIADKNYTVTAFDVDTFEKLGSYQAAYLPEKMFCTPDNQLVYLDSLNDRLLCIDDKGNLSWSMDQISDIALCGENKDTLLCLQTILLDTWETDYSLLIADMYTGTLLQNPSLLSSYFGAEYGIPTFPSDTYESSQAIIFKLQHYAAGTYSFDFAVMDAETENARIFLTTEEYIDRVSIGTDGKLYTLSVDPNAQAYLMYSVVSTQKYTATVRCYDIASKKLLWSTPISSHVYCHTISVTHVPQQNSVVCMLGNMLWILDDRSGKVTADHQACGVPVYAQATDEVIFIASSDGMYSGYFYGNPYITSFPYFNAGVSDVLVNHGVFVAYSDKGQVVLYSTLNDSNFSIVEGYPNNIIKSLVHGQRYFGLNDFGTLYMYDSETNSVLWDKEIDVMQRVLGFSPDESTFYMADGTNIYAVDTRSGNTTTYSHQEDCYTSDHLLTDSGIFFSGYYQSDAFPSLFYWNPETKELSHFSFLSEDAKSQWDYLSKQTLVYGKNNCLMLLTDAGDLYELNPQTNRSLLLMTALADTPVIAANEDQSYIAISAQDEIQIFNEERNTAASIPLNGLHAASLYFYDQMLLAVCDDFRLHRYDLNGTYLGSCELNFSSDVFTESYTKDNSNEIHWFFPSEGELILKLGDYAEIIHCESWQSRGHLISFRSYLPSQNKLMFTGEDHLLTYDLLDSEAVIQRGKQALGTFTLTDKQKESYGIQS